MADDLEIRIDEASAKKFHEGINKFLVDGPLAYGQLLKTVGRRVKRHVRAAGYSTKSGHSVGVGPGKKYGHLAGNLEDATGNIGWGGFIRIRHRKLKKFVARFHEDGTGQKGAAMPNRRSKSGRFYFAKGTGPGRGKNLPARGPMDHAYRTLDQGLLDREVSRALDKALK